MKQTIAIIAAGLALTACAASSVYQENFTGVRKQYPPTEEVLVTEVRGVTLADSKDLKFPAYIAIGHTQLVSRAVDEAALVEMARRMGAHVVIIWKEPVGASTRGRPQREFTFTDGSIVTQPPSQLQRGLIQTQFRFEIAFLRKPETLI